MPDANAPGLLGAILQHIQSQTQPNAPTNLMAPNVGASSTLPQGVDYQGAGRQFAADYNTAANSPYMSVSPNSWIARNHPRAAGFLDNALLTSSMIQPGETIGANVQNVSKALVGTPQARLEHRMQLATLPLQFEQAQAGLEKTRAEAEQARAMGEYYSARNQANIQSMYIRGVAASGAAAALRGEAGKIQYGYGKAEADNPQLGFKKGDTVWGKYQNEIVSDPGSMDPYTNQPGQKIQPNFTPLSKDVPAGVSPSGGNPRDGANDLWTRLESGEELQRVNSLRTQYGQKPLTQAQLEKDAMGWRTAPGTSLASFRNALPPSYASTWKALEGANQKTRDSLLKANDPTNDKAVAAEVLALSAQGVSAQELYPRAKANLESRQKDINAQYTQWLSDATDKFTRGDQPDKFQYGQPTQQAAPSGLPQINPNAIMNPR